MLEVNAEDQKGGVLFPHIALTSFTDLAPIITSATSADKDEHKGLIVYNTTLVNGFTRGLYVWDGASWSILDGDFFYLPPFNLPLAGTPTSKTYNLYNEYAKQFRKSGNPLFVSNNSTLTEIPGLYNAQKFTYVVTWYDKKLIDVISIDDNGILSYNVKETVPADTSFMTVVMIPKPW